MNLEVLEADLNNFKHAEAVRQLVDEYARLPIGQGTPLAARVLEQLVPGLKRHPGTLVFLAWLDRRAVGVTVCMTGFSTFTRQTSDQHPRSGRYRRLPRTGRRASVAQSGRSQSPRIGLRKNDSGGARR